MEVAVECISAAHAEAQVAWPGTIAGAEGGWHRLRGSDWPFIFAETVAGEYQMRRSREVNRAFVTGKD